MAADRASPDSLPERLGTFEIVRPAGRGALGDLWEANDPAASRRLLVQIMPEHLAGRPRACELLREAAYGARVVDPHVLSAEFVGQTGRHIYVATPFVVGGTLAERMAQPRMPDQSEALRICSQCLQGLSAAHAAGIVHGNLQPASIRLDGDRALVTDFRLAQALAPVTQQPGLPPGSYLVDYLSPEQTRGDAFGPQADLYALGVILFQLLAGKLPFQAETRASMAFQHMYEPPPGLSRFIPDIPGPLSAMVEKLLAKDLGERYQTTLQIQADLTAWLSGAPLPSRQHADEAVSPRPVSPRKEKEPAATGEAPHIESLSQVWNLLSTTQAEISQLQRERDELSARLQKVDESEWTSAVRRRGDSVKTRAAQWALVGGLLLLGVYLIWNAWSESQLIPKFRDLPPGTMANLPKGKNRPGLNLITNAVASSQGKNPAPAVDEDQFPRSLVNSLGHPLVFLPAASLYMGNHEPQDQVQIDLGVEAGEIEDEYPLHLVQLSRGFYLGQHEITQAEFERVMGYNPSAFSQTGLYAQRVAGMDTRRLPVESVSWDEAVEFCRRLGEFPEEKRAGRTYRLPTEAEWEYACRGAPENGLSRYPFGNSLTSLSEHAWIPNRRDEPPYPVAELAPTRHDLYDLAGNVGEWCQDVYNSRAYSMAIGQMAIGLEETRKSPHVVRRGPRCSERGYGGPDPSPSIGFRIACTLDASPPSTTSPVVRPAPLPLVTVVNSAGMKFVRLPAGRFRRDISKHCRLITQDGKGDETPPAPQDEERCQHLDAQVQRPFYLGMHEVTQAQYQKVWDSRSQVASGTETPSRDAPQSSADGALPVDRVSWYDAAEFCRRLSALPEERAASRSYRLPTELEWEYASRTPNQPAATIPDNEWVRQNSGGQPHRVGTLASNSWGLHDLLGNAAEWVADRAPEPIEAVKASSNAEWARVIRGGSYREPALPRSERRAAPALAAVAGFRIVLEYAVPATAWSGPARLTELQPATRHPGEIRAALFSVNQRLALSAGDDFVVRVWDFETGREVEPFAGLRSVIRSLAVSSSGHFLATGSDDGEVNLWSFPRRKVLHTFAGHQGRVYALAFSPEGDGELFSAGEDRTVRIWDVEKKLPCDQLIGRDAQLLSLEFPPETTQLLAGGNQGAIMAWNFLSGRELPLLQVGRLPVLSLQALDTRRILTSGLLSHCLWDIPTASRALSSAPVRKPLRVVRASPDRSFLAGGDEQGNLDLCALTSGSRKKAFPTGTDDVELTAIGPRLATMPKAHAGPVRSLHISADGRRILTAGADGHVRLWSIQFQQQSPADVAPDLRLLAVSASGHQALTYGGDRQLRLWDPTNCRQIRELADAGPEVSAVALSPDGQLAACGGTDQKVRVWDTEGGKLLHTFSGHPGDVLQVVFSGDGARLASASADGSLRLWNLQAPGNPVVCSGHKGAVSYAAFLEGNRRVASAGEDGTLRFWNSDDGKEIQVCSLGTRSKTAPRPPVVVTPNGETAFIVQTTPHGGAAIAVWNLELSREIGRLMVRSPQIVGLHLSSDGRFLIAAESSDMATVWDLRNPEQPLCELTVPRPSCAALAFTSTAGHAVLASREGGLRSWDLPVYRILQNREN